MRFSGDSSSPSSLYWGFWGYFGFWFWGNILLFIISKYLWEFALFIALFIISFCRFSSISLSIIKFLENCGIFAFICMGSSRENKFLFWNLLFLFWLFSLSNFSFSNFSFSSYSNSSCSLFSFSFCCLNLFSFICSSSIFWYSICFFFFSSLSAFSLSIEEFIKELIFELFLLFGFDGVINLLLSFIPI